VKNTTFRNILVTGLVGVVAFGSMNILTAQAPAEDIVAPKDVAAAPTDAEKTKSGLASKVLKAGTGKEKPTAEDTVTVHYSGWETNGKMFDSSVKRGAPSSFPLNRVIKGWTEGLQLMVVGEKRRFWIPANLAYGDTPSRPGGPSGTLCFDVELLEIKKAPKMPKVPADLVTIPENAIESEGGVKSIVLTPGKGAQPIAEDVILVNYTGWDKTGKVIDSSVRQGAAVPIPLASVPPALSAGLKLMKAGETRQFWIPAKHILGETPKPGAPEGPFCFQFEFIKVVEK